MVVDLQVESPFLENRNHSFIIRSGLGHNFLKRPAFCHQPANTDQGDPLRIEDVVELMNVHGCRGASGLVGKQITELIFGYKFRVYFLLTNSQ